MSDLLIAAPVALEARMISAGRPPAWVRRTGMGPRRSRAAVPALLEDPGEALLVMGFGGGLARDSQVGDVVVAEEVRGPGGERVACAGTQRLAEALDACGLRVRCGTVLSVTRVAIGKTRARLGETGALAVDMESVWLAPGAGERPFAVVRVLSDTPTRELTRPLLTVAGFARASMTLRRVATALHDWTPGE
ncbi:MAG: 1-hydroxy-2-methyl-2-butenyl 4-diphosphate reductase [Solirubrobacterales bacterium]